MVFVGVQHDQFECVCGVGVGEGRRGVARARLGGVCISAGRAFCGVV